MKTSKPQVMDYASLNALATQYGDSFFVLDGSRFAQNFQALRKAFSVNYGDVQIGYSYKTNYTPQLCQIVHELGGYAEVVSEMEYAHAKRLGVPGNRIIFNGPVKARWAFEEAALSGATLNLDSMNDLVMLKQVAEANSHKTIAVVIRTNFAIGEAISRFGIDVDGKEFEAAINVIEKTSNIYLKGLHCHFPDRDLDSFKRRAYGMVELVRRVFGKKPPEVINIGGGFFSYMPESLRAKFNVSPVSFADYGQEVGEIFSTAFEGQSKPTLFLEPGTALVADTQVFYTRVISVKSVRGKHFATVAGSSFDISPTARSRSLPVTVVPASLREDKVALDVVGFTCIEGDILTEGLVASLRPGDFLCYSNVGSYSVVMRPPFILPTNPILYDGGDGNLTLIKRRQRNEDVFRDFTF